MYFVRLGFLQFLVFTLSEARIRPSEEQRIASATSASNAKLGDSVARVVVVVSFMTLRHEIDIKTLMSAVDSMSVTLFFIKTKTQEFCKNKTVSLEVHPYHAVLIPYCGDHSRAGVIISDRYVISATDPSISRREDACEYNVQVGANTEDGGIANHEAKIIFHGEISIFELEKPIKFGRRAQKIELADEAPKSGEQNVVTKLIGDSLASTNMYAYNITVLSDRDCKRLISERSPIDLKTCENTLWVDWPKLIESDVAPAFGICRSMNNAALIDKHGRLVGIEDYKGAFGLEIGRQIDGFVDLALHKATIEKYTKLNSKLTT